MKQELGITASIGVSYNKIFAKLGSDMKKPDATTVIGVDFREKIWQLPADMLLYVGKATYAKLIKHRIHTIGDLACTDPVFLERLLGKNGIMLWSFANGIDHSPVCRSVQISIRDNTLFSYERQGQLRIPSCTSQAIFEKSYELYRNNRPANPVRSLGVRACKLSYMEYRLVPP